MMIQKCIKKKLAGFIGEKKNLYVQEYYEQEIFLMSKILKIYIFLFLKISLSFSGKEGAGVVL